MHRTLSMFLSDLIFMGKGLRDIIRATHASIPSLFAGVVTLANQVDTPRKRRIMELDSNTEPHHNQTKPVATQVNPLRQYQSNKLQHASYLLGQGTTHPQPKLLVSKCSWQIGQ